MGAMHSPGGAFTRPRCADRCTWIDEMATCGATWCILSRRRTIVTAHRRLPSPLSGASVKSRDPSCEILSLTYAIKHQITYLSKIGSRNRFRIGMMTSGRPPNSCPKPSINWTVQPIPSSSARCSAIRGPIRILWQQPATNSSLFPANAMRGQVNFETASRSGHPRMLR
jgi:hypothetical protein